MFEIIDGSDSAEPTINAGVHERVQAVFSKAKQLKAAKEKLFSMERQKREANPLSTVDGRVIHQKSFQTNQIPGMDTLSKNYDETIKSLMFENISECESHLAAIQQERTETENRLIDITQQQVILNETFQELELKGISLEEQSGQYIEAIANGDIGAADIAENERLEQVKANNTNKQECAHKLAAFKQAEYPLKQDIAIYDEMGKSLHRHLLLQQYKATHEKLDEQISSMIENYQALDSLASRLWGTNYDRWEHLNQIKALMHGSKDYATSQQNASNHQTFVNSGIAERNPKFYR